MTSLSNPAAPFLMTNIQSLRSGFLGPLSLGYEMGDVKDLEDQVEELEKILEKDYGDSDGLSSFVELDDLVALVDPTDLAALIALGDLSDLSKADIESLGITDAEINALVLEGDNEVSRSISEANSILNNVGETAYIKLSGALQVPFMPVIYKTQKHGAFMLDSGLSFVGRVGVLSDDISVRTLDEGVELVSDTAVYLKRASDFRIGLGYSQAVGRPVSGALILGGKINLHQIALGQKLSFLTNEDDSATDAFGDFLMDRDNVQSGISIDLGAIWTAPNYQLGVAATSINEPEFDFEELGQCNGLSGPELSSCNSTIRLSNKGKLKLKETYKMKAQLKLDAALMSSNQNWSLAGSYEVNPVADAVGDKHQWQTVSLSYFSDNFYFPGVRVGYRKNQAGSQLSYATVGVTLIRRLDFDIAYGLEKPEGESLPRSVYFSLGYGLAF
ncbi:conjugal transfer protein TraF [Marinomonas rhizomae]|uniref:conjugal transfer protein TraF n=1 Tax=Marinomonas rhizomae TaxID=491948 RepID=UPI0021060983|nr:conjugal transfer protein TraF [Marinomonas rhizomae]UTW00479.1 conjugal transfer protein TraF [Marinomonas rhizomae]